MLRDELLRSKNDEIARCLLSRKRKLSELYFATVGFAGGATDGGGASTDSRYQQKEQAFLDANDLSKGRLFNETTLPSLPDYASLFPRPDTQDTATPATEVDAKARIPLSQGDVGVPAPSGTTVEQPRQHPAGDSPPAISPAQPNVERRVEEPPAPDTAPESARVPNGLSGTGVQPGNLAISDQKGNASMPDTPLSSQEHDSAVPVPMAADSAAETTQMQQSGQKKRPSLAIGLSKQSSDQQPLSPVSSAGQYSGNTPIPAPTSPDTSPGEDATIDGKEFAPKSKLEASAQAPPSLVPSTPDEQLRLEEAQSIQQNTLTANKSIGDGVNNNYPSSNEVIQDNVASPDTSKGPPPPLPSDVKKLDGVVEPASDSLASAQPEQPQMPVDAASKATAPVDSGPKKIQTTPGHQGPPPERMTTRVSSGAIRHKSVSEILGETPKSSLSPSEKAHPDKFLSDATSITQQKSPPESPARMRFKDRKDREKERSRPSTVVFPKQQMLQLQQQQLQEKADSMDVMRQNVGDLARLKDEQDYLFTLFQNKAYSPPRGTNLGTLIASAHKTLSTGNHLVDYQEQMDCRTLRRIYALQNANRWPLRQFKRSVEPPRQGTHWDMVLSHMKWMRTDFREERKWKIAAAKCCADWCAEYVNSDPEHRALLRVQAKIPPKSVEIKKENIKPSNDVASPAELGDEMPGISHATPDLVPSTEEDSVDEAFNDEPRHDLHDTVAPAAIFSLGSDEITFSLDMTPAAEKIFEELPIYAPVGIVPETKLPDFKAPPDSVWKTDILPVSKYALGKIRFSDERDEGPIKKRSRYDYTQYEPESEQPLLELQPEQTNVALFQPENKAIRDRVHPGHSFRPPTEYPMPSVGFFESRQSSQWTYAEDDELRRLVKEYPYNWSLISSCLSPSSQFTSGAERRTPWECFERWIGLEGLPAEMSKTPYFRAYHQRLETAQRTVLAQQQAAQEQQQQQQQQQPNNPQAQAPIRRRTTQPLRVERRRSSKHLALLDAMRKLAKKRETMLQKQQHASQLASLRKVNEANQPKPPISTPAEFSRLKYDREMKLQERQEQYRQQMLAQQRASVAAQRAGQVPNQQPIMNAPPGRAPNGMSQNGTPGMPNGAPNGMTNGMAAGVNQGRSMQGMPAGAPANGTMAPNPMAMKMMPQSGMQQAAGSRPGVPMQTTPENARVIREANRLQEQQRILQSRQQPHQQTSVQQPQQFHSQQQFGTQGSNSPNLNMAGVNGAPNNPAMMAAIQASGGMQSPSFPNGTTQGVSTPSPRMGQPNPLSGGMVPTISNIQSQIQRANPNMSPEQVNKLATDRLHQYQQQRMSQVAMNAAAGNVGSVQANYQVSPDVNFHQSPQGGTNGTPGTQVPQAQGYSPMMRVAQPAQPNRMNAGSPAKNGPAPQPSRSATPQAQRSNSSQGGPVSGSKHSPNAPPAQTATG